jgi:hypothetical protein
MADQPDAQFPSPRLVPDEPFAETESLAPPGELSQTQIAAHLAWHGIAPFVLAEHVYLGGPRRAAQCITWNPAKGTYMCGRCGKLFSTGEITGEQILSAQLFEPGLRAFLVGPLTQDERDEITRRYLRGELSAAVLRVASKGERRRPTTDKRPAVRDRRARVQRWMLERYAARGVVERVIEEAVTMQHEEPARWREIAVRTLEPSTLRRYWQLIDDDLVAQARAAHKARERK